MSTFNRLSEVFKASIEIPFNNSSKIVLISDCHRGDGGWIDNFTHNQHIYYSALKYYYNNDFTYIDLGDSDELWKNKKFSDISNVYIDIFRLLHNFYKENRFYMIFGNHDIVKKDPVFIKKNLQRYYDNHTDNYEPLFENIKVHEGITLTHTETKTKIFLVHGHQGDLLDDVFWRLGRFLVRNFWRRLELFGFKDITSAAKNNAKKKKVERKVLEWAIKNKQMVIIGHTHRPTCSPNKVVPYFNDGSCVHPNCITCIEIVNSEITLVKWNIRTKEDRTLYVNRQVIALPRKIL